MDIPTPVGRRFREKTLRHYSELKGGLAARRAAHLHMAIGMSLQTFGPSSEWTGDGRSDRFWLDLFSDPDRKLIDSLIMDFIVQYSLHRRGGWMPAEVISVLQPIRRGVCAPKDIDKLTTTLMAGEKRPSAASKFAFFCQPDAKHHIMDSRVCTALNARGGAPFLPVTAGTYSTFFNLVAAEYEDECSRRDFQRAFATYLDVGALHDFRRMCFLRRHFFDKFLFVQGVAAEAALARAKCANPDTLPRRPKLAVRG